MKIHAKILDNTASMPQGGATRGRTESDDTTFGDTLSTFADDAGGAAAPQDLTKVNFVSGSPGASGTGGMVAPFVAFETGRTVAVAGDFGAALAPPDATNASGSFRTSVTPSTVATVASVAPGSGGTVVSVDGSGIAAEPQFSSNSGISSANGVVASPVVGVAPFLALATGAAILPAADRGGGSLAPASNAAASSKPPLAFLDLVQVAATSKGVPIEEAGNPSPMDRTVAPTRNEPMDKPVEGPVTEIVDRISPIAAGPTKASDRTPSPKVSSGKTSPDTQAPDASVAPMLQVAVDPSLMPFPPATVPQGDGLHAETPGGDAGAGSPPAVALAGQVFIPGPMAAPPAKRDDTRSIPVVGDVRFESYLAPASIAPATLGRPNAPASAAATPKATDPSAAPADASVPAMPSPSASALDTGPIQSSKPRSSDETPPVLEISGVARGAEVVPQQGLAAPLSLPTRAVLDAVNSLAAEAPASPAVGMADTPSRTTPARTMLLQLTPGDLGTVSVRLHLTGHTLDVSLTASSAETTGLLSRDRDALGSALRGHDYQVNSLVIQGADAPGGGDASPQSGGFGASTQDMSKGQGTSDERSGLSGGNGRQAQDERPSRQNKSQNPATARFSSGDRANGLFL